MFKVKDGIRIGATEFVNSNRDITAGTISASDITISGELKGPATMYIDPAAIGDNTGTLVIRGNLQIDGTTTTINSTTLSVDDLNILLADGAANAAAANGAGITIGGAGATFNYASSGDKWQANKSLETSSQLISTVATGTSPLAVTSTTAVTNLNADLLDGYHASDFALSGHVHSYLPLSGGTLTGKTTFPSAIADRPQFPGGILGLNAGDGNFDIWGISTEYYPSHSVAANAWGIRWDGDSNQVRFIGGGNVRLAIDLDGGASALTWDGNVIINASNKGSYTFPPESHTHSYLPLTGGTLSGDLIINSNDGLKVIYGSTDGQTWYRGWGMESDRGAVYIRPTGNSNQTLRIGYSEGSQSWNLVRVDAASFTQNGNQIWHAGNDGSGSGLDADSVDGYDSTTLMAAQARKEWVNISASGAQARRWTIARVYGTPNHWINIWQNIRIKILQEDYSSGYVEYNLFGYYGMGNGNSWILRLKDADGANVQYFQVSLGTVTAAGWNYSGQPTYYQDVYVDVDYYTTVRVIATTYGHGYQNTNPTDGTSGCYTVFYDSPSATNITYSDAGKASTYHFGEKIWNGGNDGSGSGLDADLLDGYHAASFIKTSGTINNNIDSDYGEGFVTFDPIPSGTPPAANPNIRTINIGNDFNRRTQLAFTYNTNQAWFRRKHDANWGPWVEFLHTENWSTYAAAVSHNHDDRYYTETESDDRFLRLDFPVTTAATAWNSNSGTWTTAVPQSAWGSYKPGDDSAGGYAYNDAPGWAQFNVPSGYSTVYIGQLRWSSGGYFDVHAVRSDGTLVFRGRYLSLNSIENTDHGGDHDGQQVIKISGLDGMTAVRITNVSGRLHLQSLGWTKEQDTAGTQVSETHWDLIYNKPTIVTSISATSPITASASTGAVTLSHANSGVTAGTYNNVTVNATGHVTGGSNVAYLTSYTETDTLATVTSRGNVSTSHINVPAGEGTAFGFWNDPGTYGIAMGVSAGVYQYGPVTDYSIKMYMSNNSGRGWTWGVAGAKPIAALNTLGNMQIAGNFAAASKSFLIPHPTKPGKKLRYGSLEGPENGVYVRGRLRGTKIELPDYWTGLVDPDSITVQLTPHGRRQDIWVTKIENNCVYVQGTTQPDCYYFIQAERIDVAKLEVEID